MEPAAFRYSDSLHRLRELIQPSPFDSDYSDTMASSEDLPNYKRLESLATGDLSVSETEQLRQLHAQYHPGSVGQPPRPPPPSQGLLSPTEATKKEMSTAAKQALQFAEALSQQGSGANPEELLFELFKLPGSDEVSIGRFLSALKSLGLSHHDPRLKPMFDKIKQIERQRTPDESENRHWILDRENFKDVVSESLVLVVQALRNNLVIPDWGEFCTNIASMYEKCKNISDGKVASYIPQLARMNPNYWGVSICTVDGQRASWGDSRIPFSFQSTSKAFNYAIAASDMGADFVHQHVGQEPSGRLFNEICLDPQNKPHNPMVNAGAIIVSSLIKPEMNMADRFDYMYQRYKKLAGDEYIGFNNAVFLSERETADRNFALSYYMKEYKCFQSTASVRELLDFYFQMCSLETNCESAAVMAASLANGGICPLTGEKCLDNRPCRDVLSLMYSCGMYDYSGKFAFHVGLPAKSGVSGALIIVIPNLMGICVWSPPLDQMGNSVRGVQFCKELVNRFNFHNYDSLLHTETKKNDPRKRATDVEAEQVVFLLFAAKSGDVGAVRRFYMQGSNLEMADYDGRTALHVAASEGHVNLVRFLLDTGKVAHNPKDRWSRTPLEDAIQFHHSECAHVLETMDIRRSSHNASNNSSITSNNAAFQPTSGGQSPVGNATYAPRKAVDVPATGGGYNSTTGGYTSPTEAPQRPERTYMNGAVNGQNSPH